MDEQRQDAATFRTASKQGDKWVFQRHLSPERTPPDLEGADD